VEAGRVPERKCEVELTLGSLTAVRYAMASLRRVPQSMQGPAPAVFAPLKAHKPPSLLPLAATLVFIARQMGNGDLPNFR
jgi:hypothetical protein